MSLTQDEYLLQVKGKTELAQLRREVEKQAEALSLAQKGTAAYAAEEARLKQVIASNLPQIQNLSNEIEDLERKKQRAERSGRGLNRSMLDMARLADDAQYGLRGIGNNLVEILGPMGAFGGAMALAIAGMGLWNTYGEKLIGWLTGAEDNIGTFLTSTEKLTKEIDKQKKVIEELTKQSYLDPDEVKRLATAREKLAEAEAMQTKELAKQNEERKKQAEYEAILQGKDPEQLNRQQAYKKAVGDLGGRANQEIEGLLKQRIRSGLDDELIDLRMKTIDPLRDELDQYKRQIQEVMEGEGDQDKLDALRKKHNETLSKLQDAEKAFAKFEQNEPLDRAKSILQRAVQGDATALEFLENEFPLLTDEQGNVRTNSPEARAGAAMRDFANVAAGGKTQEELEQEVRVEEARKNAEQRRKDRDEEKRRTEEEVSRMARRYGPAFGDDLSIRLSRGDQDAQLREFAARGMTAQGVAQGIASSAAEQIVREARGRFEDERAKQAAAGVAGAEAAKRIAEEAAKRQAGIRDPDAPKRERDREQAIGKLAGQYDQALGPRVRASLLTPGVQPEQSVDWAARQMTGAGEDPGLADAAARRIVEAEQERLKGDRAGFGAAGIPDRWAQDRLQRDANMRAAGPIGQFGQQLAQDLEPTYGPIASNALLAGMNPGAVQGGIARAMIGRGADPRVAQAAAAATVDRERQELIQMAEQWRAMGLNAQQRQLMAYATLGQAFAKMTAEQQQFVARFANVERWLNAVMMSQRMQGWGRAPMIWPQ